MGERASLQGRAGSSLYRCTNAATIVVFSQLPERSRGRSGGGGGLKAVGVTTATREGAEPESVCVCV